VVAEFNRYATTPIRIESPGLGDLPVSGVFNVDDTESMVAFLRSLAGVKVEVTPSAIRVSGG
jgi:ferric-dicitrate binding protein FerR (iron transport regulator)